MLLPVTQRRAPSMVVRAKMAAPSPEKVKMGKRKDGLYLLQWRGNTAPSTTPVQPGANAAQLMQLRDELKMLEKVSKDALWFTVKEASEGRQHVLMVTDDRKKAKKYGLQELCEEGAVVQLEGVEEPISIPVAQLRAELIKRMEEDSDSSEDEDEMMGRTKLQAATAAVEGLSVAEDPRAAAQAAALLGMQVKQERKKMKDVAKAEKERDKEEEKLKKKEVKEEKQKSKKHKKEDDMSIKQGAVPVAAAAAMVAAGVMGDESESESSESSESESSEDECAVLPGGAAVLHENVVPVAAAGAQGSIVPQPPGIQVKSGKDGAGGDATQTSTMLSAKTMGDEDSSGSDMSGTESGSE